MLLYLVKLACRNMWRHRIRSLLTLVGIAVAIIAFGILRTVVDSWYAGAALGSSSRLITRNAASLTLALPLTYAERIRHQPGVTGVTWENWFGGIYIDQKHFFPQFAVDAPTFMAMCPEYKLSSQEQSDFIHDKRGVVVGRKLAHDYGFKVGDSLVLRGTLYPGDWNFVVRGIYQGADHKVDETQLLMHWDYLNDEIKQRMPAYADKVGVFIDQIADASEAGSISAGIDRSFQNSLAETRTETQKAFQLGFVAMVDTILVALQSVAYVVILIIMAVMANTMAMTARERVREYATLKVLGFSQSFVFALILGESLSLSLCGGVLGAALTFPLAHLFFLATGRMFIVFQVTSMTVFLQACSAVIVGCVAALAPGISSARARIVDGLRAVS